MEEKIIIDGIDVTECEQFFNLLEKKCALLDQVYCEENHDCYYKQLKRLEQENEELKEKFRQVTILLPKEIDDMEKLVWTLNFDDLVMNVAKYKQALEEIREMLPESKCKYACFSCPESGQCEEQWAEPIKRIITEAIGG